MSIPFNVKLKCKNCGENFVILNQGCYNEINKDKTEINTKQCMDRMCNLCLPSDYPNSKGCFYVPNARYCLCEKCKQQLLPQLTENPSEDKLRKQQHEYMDKFEELKAFAFCGNEIIDTMPYKWEDNNVDQYSILRDKYKPNKVKFLFVGESRPYSGNYFYCKNSYLYFYTKKAFEQAGIDFSIQTFKNMGCWLYDVCDEPVNKGLSKAERRKLIINGLNNLENVVNELKPEYVFVVKKGDMKLAFEKVCSVGYISGITTFNLHFPSCSWQEKYADELEKILKRIFINERK